MSPSQHNSSIGTPEKGTLKGKQKIPAACRTAPLPTWHNLYLLYFSVHEDFHPQNRAAWSSAAEIGVSIPIHLSTVAPYGSWHAPCEASPQPCCPGQGTVAQFLLLTLHNPHLCFSNSKCCGFYLLCGARWALTQQGTQLLH